MIQLSPRRLAPMRLRSTESLRQTGRAECRPRHWRRRCGGTQNPVAVSDVRNSSWQSNRDGSDKDGREQQPVEAEPSGAATPAACWRSGRASRTECETVTRAEPAEPGSAAIAQRTFRISRRRTRGEAPIDCRAVSTGCSASADPIFANVHCRKWLSYARPPPPAGRGGAAISSRFHAVMR